MRPNETTCPRIASPMIWPIRSIAMPTKGHSTASCWSRRSVLWGSYPRRCTKRCPSASPVRCRKTSKNSTLLFQCHVCYLHHSDAPFLCPGMRRFGRACAARLLGGFRQNAQLGPPGSSSDNGSDPKRPSLFLPRAALHISHLDCRSFNPVASHP
jgi:hypothetical protein